MRLSLVIVTMLILAGTSVAGPINPMSDPFGYFGVYSLNNIGTVASPYHSDFQGIAGAAGNAYFSWFSLHGNDSSTGYVLHTGGSAQLTGSYLGSLEIGGNANLGSININGNVVSGGNIVNTGGGSMTGSAIAGGQVNLSQQFTVAGQKLSNQSYDPIVDHDALVDFFLDTSATIGQLAPTGAVSNSYGLLSFTGTHGVNVIELSAQALKNAWGFNITAPSDAIIYINVTGANAQLDSTVWSYGGGITAGDVLLNYSQAESLFLTSSNAVNILAPQASTYFDSGLIQGGLVVGNLQGGGQVNLGHFEHGGEVPEPATILTLLAGGAVLLRRPGRRALA